MSKTTVVYDGLLNPENVIACQEGDVMEERDKLKAYLIGFLGIEPEKAYAWVNEQLAKEKGA